MGGRPEIIFMICWSQHISTLMSSTGGCPSSAWLSTGLLLAWQKRKTLFTAFWANSSKCTSSPFLNTNLGTHYFPNKVYSVWPRSCTTTTLLLMNEENYYLCSSQFPGEGGGGELFTSSYFIFPAFSFGCVKTGLDYWLRVINRKMSPLLFYVAKEKRSTSLSI